MMKRILSTVLALLLAVSFVMSAALAAGTPTVSITSGEVKPGEKVTLTVSVTDNPGLAATLLYIYYDTSVFEVDPNSDLRATGSFRQDGGLIGNSIETAKKNGRYDGEAGKDGVLALWYNSSGLNTTGDGGMLTVTLTAKSTAANGNYTVGIGYSSDDTCNEAGSEVSLATGSGTVSVSGSTVTKPEQPPAQDGGAVPGVAPQPGTSVEPVVFSDISGNWAEDYILRANAAGLVGGYQGKYRPNDTMTRAEFVSVLWRASGEPKASAPSTFTDLRQDWYKDAVAWSQENNVINGVGDNQFGPDDPLTREQIITILHRLAGTPTGEEMLYGSIYNEFFPDSGKVGGWAKQAVYWGLYNQILCGEGKVALYEGDDLSPRQPADRAQIAVMMVRYLDKLGGNS